MVKESLWAEDQVITENDEEGATIITFTSTQTYKVLEWTLSQGKKQFPLNLTGWLKNGRIT